MHVEHHDLHSDFPEFKDAINALTSGNPHFASLFASYHRLTGKVEDLEEHKGELAGKILFLDKAPEHDDPKEPVFVQYDAAKLDEIFDYSIYTRHVDDSFRRLGLA